RLARRQARRRLDQVPVVARGSVSPGPTRGPALRAGPGPLGGTGGRRRMVLDLRMRRILVCMGDDSSRHSSSIEDYMRAIYGLVERGEPVTNASLAGRLEVSPSSASGMVTKLAQQGLVEHVPYRGSDLTSDGMQLARSVLRRHRLIETYLVSELGYTWDEVHEEADRLEHVLSDRLVERIA